MTRTQQPAVSEEYSVGMPEAGVVYYDTVLETVATVHEVSEDFVTYVIEQDVDNVHSDPMQKFLASLAADRFVKIGVQQDEGGLEARVSDISRVYAQMYGADPSVMDPIEIAKLTVEKETGVKIDEKIEMDDQE